LSFKTCEVCRDIEAKGYSDIAHCGGPNGCHRTWGGHAEAHCAVCHRQFGGDVAFMAHQADGICRDPAQLKTRTGRPRFRIVERKHGVVWIQNDERVFAEV
jgi:hypothetical protein